MDNSTIIFGCILSSILLIWMYLTKNHGYWQVRGVPYRKPQLFFGNIKDRVMLRQSIHEFVRSFYEEMKNNRFAGFYEGMRPVLVILDPELIKLVLVKHFDHFMDRPIIKFKNDAYLDKIMVSLKGNEWKNTRSACSPAYSSGRLKLMAPLVDTSGREMIEYLKSITPQSGEVTLDIGKLVLNYNLNTIASTLFGLNLNSFADEESEFTRSALDLQNVPVIKILTFLVCLLLEVPDSVTQHLPISFLNDKSMSFFAKSLIETKNYRLKSGLRRNDLLQLIIDAQTAPIEAIGEADEDISGGKKKLLDEETAIAQLIFFFVAGFETTTTTLAMACYELAKNLDVQKQARDDVFEHWPPGNHGLTYDMMNSMSYIDMVISETLRLYSPLSGLEREVTKPIQLTDTLKLDYGTEILIPITGLHMDPRYFPAPEKFRPERFSPANRSVHHPYVYLPFGAGPRNCMGFRFANLNTRACLAYLLRNYRIDISENTPISFVHDPKTFFLKSKHNIILKLTSIS